MKKLGIFGGAFNPPHKVHIDIANYSINYLNLDKLLVIPTKIAPHKNIEEIFGIKLRLLLTKIAFYSIDPSKLKEILLSEYRNFNFENFIDIYKKNYEQFHNEIIEVSDIEISNQKNDVSYTYNTIFELKKVYSDYNFYLIIGMDQALILHTWYNIENLIDMVVFCLVNRNNITIDYVKKYLKDKINKMPSMIDLKYKEKNISSTIIRQQWGNIEVNNQFLPEILVEFFKIYKNK